LVSYHNGRIYIEGVQEQSSEKREAGENYIMREYTIFTPHQILLWLWER
jgi:hypothetical protein